jgi:hypothetical protein
MMNARKQNDTLDATHGARAGAAVYSRDGARVGTITRVFHAVSAGPNGQDRYAFLLEPGPIPTASGPHGPICLPASAIVNTEPDRVLLRLTRKQLAT